MRIENYNQGAEGIERDRLIINWYKNLPQDERNQLNRMLRKHSNKIKSMDVISMLQLFFAIYCLLKDSNDQ